MTSPQKPRQGPLIAKLVGFARGDTMTMSPRRAKRTALIAQLVALAIGVGLTIYGLATVRSGGGLEFVGWLTCAIGLFITVMLVILLVLWFRFPDPVTDADPSGDHERIDP